MYMYNSFFHIPGHQGLPLHHLHLHHLQNHHHNPTKRRGINQNDTGCAIAMTTVLLLVLS